VKLSDLGEEGLLSLLRDWTESASTHVRLGPGDDAAILAPLGEREIVVSTDAWVDGVHFSREYLAPDEIGQRAMAGSLSDLAAMGADGVAAFVNVHAPPDTSVDFLRQIYVGMARVADACGVAIAGGDTVRGPLAFDVTVIGAAAPGQAIRRDGAQSGDVVCVSGELGGAEAGRRILAKEVPDEIPPQLAAEAESVHRTPRPRFDVARLVTSLERRTVDLARKRETKEPVRPTAMMDVSDGLGIDLTRLCEASGVGCRIEDRHIPVNGAARRLARLDGGRESDLALGGGEDFELLFTMPAKDVDVLMDAAHRASLRITSIGVITPLDEGRVLVLENGDEVPLEAAGWDHFRGSAS
jgi:thiamine-monophosphate kinase